MKNGKFSLRREDGQALVELAFAIPLLLFVLFAIIDFGLAINQYNDVTNLANLGARATSVLSTSNTIPQTCTPAGTSQTTTTLIGFLDCEGAQDNSSLGNLTVVVCDPTSSTNPWTTGDTIKVAVSGAFSWFTIITGGDGRVAGLGPLTTSISSSATLRMEGTGETDSAGWFGTATWTGGPTGNITVKHTATCT